MSLADEVLAEHAKARLGDYCSVCHDQWPCESVRLALSLQAAEKVVEAAQKVTNAVQMHLNHYGLALSGLRGVTSELDAALAEYDKGGQG